jgi:septal ring factor EnvC (AmiA/AmiB activator)
MARPTLSPLQRQLGRVRRRLFLRVLGRRLALGAASALLVAAVGLLLAAHGHLRGDPSPLTESLPHRLAWVGVALGGGTVLAVVLAVLRRPSRLVAALALDRDCDLKERATTCLCLTAEQRDSPAGQALLDDANRHTDTITVAAAFPLRPSRIGALVPVAFLFALLAALFCEPAPLPQDPGAEEASAALSQPNEVARRLRQLSDRPAVARPKPASRQEARDIESELERLAAERPTTRGEGRDLLKDLTALEDRMRRQEKALAERADALRQQAAEADRLTRKKRPMATPAERSLGEGDFRKANDELQRLSRPLKDGLTSERAEQLRRELDDLKEHLDRLADLKEKQDQAQKEAAKDGLSPEELKQLEQVKVAGAAELEELKEAGKELGQAAELLRQKKEKEAADRLARAGRRLGKLDRGGEQAELARQLALLQEAKSAVVRSLGGRPAPASGKRPESAARDMTGQDTRIRGSRSDGRLSGLRHVPGRGLKGPQTPAELRALIEEAAREAAEALDRQRLSRAEGDTARGYFERLRGAPADGP